MPVTRGINYVGAAVYLTASQSIAAGGDVKVNTWAGIDHNKGGVWNSTLQRMEIPAGFAGTWAIFGGQRWQAVANSGSRYIMIWKNGVIFKLYGVGINNGDSYTDEFYDEIECAATDYFEFYVHQNTAGPLNLAGTQADSYFGMSFKG